jgi:hypothetical protein
MAGTPGASQIRSTQQGATPPNIRYSTGSANVANTSQFNADQTKGTAIILKPKVNNTTVSEVLRYPKNITDLNTDYVVFDFFTYDPPFGKGKNQVSSQTQFSAENAYSFYNASGLAIERKNKATGFSSIILYMPEDIQSQYGARWGGADFSTGTVGMMRTFGGELPDESVALSAVNGMTKSKFYDEVLKGINSMTGSTVSLDQFMGSVSGTILNPNTEMLYQGADLRTFALTFKMTPKNIEEAKEIKKICNSFKKAMLPSLGGGSIFGTTAVSLLSVPNLCQVTYMTGPEINTYLPAYKLCAIAGVDVNYTPDGAYATYEGGSPVSTQLTISFKETKLLFSNDIDLEGASF